MRPAALPAPDVLSARRAYDLSAPYYDDWKWQDFWRRHEYPAIAGIMQALLPAPPFAPLLDVGCGTGWYLSKLACQSSGSVGVDLSPGMLDRARISAPAATLVQADAQDLPFTDQQFSVVLSTRVLSHLPNVTAAIREMCRVTRAGGTVILSNVDAGFDYDVTRLPTRASHVKAETYKYARQAVARAFRDARMRHSQSVLIDPKGGIARTASLATANGRQSVAWISAWQKPGSFRAA